MDDDCNTASAIGYIFALVRMVNRTLEDKKLRASQDLQGFLSRFLELINTWGQVLGLFTTEPQVFLEQLRSQQAVRKGIDITQVENLLHKRQEARAQKDFALSDLLRDQLFTMGVELRDTPTGVVWDIV